MPEKKSSLSPKSTSQDLVEIHTEDYKHLSTVLDEDTSNTMSLLDASTQRLYNLMHSQMEEHERKYLNDENPGEMKYEAVDKVCALAKEVREMIKLKVDIARLKKDIIKDLRIN